MIAEFFAPWINLWAKAMANDVIVVSARSELVLYAAVAVTAILNVAALICSRLEKKK